MSGEPHRIAIRRPRRALITVFIGAIILAIQNGIMFGGFLVWLGDNDDGFRIGSSSFFIDVLGMAFLGAASSA